MKILTVNINKGGTGKTTFAFNFAEYLSKNHRVLLMDLDDSGNLTGRYDVNPIEENTIVSLFDKETVKPLTITPTLDLICSFYGVDALKERQSNRRRREYALGKWLAKNYDTLKQTYDYIVIDTENDEGILTINALIISDVVVGIAEPSKDAVTALAALKYFVNDLNNDFDANTKVCYLGNRINFSENASKDFLSVLESKSEYIGYLPRRTVIAEDIALFDNPRVDTALKQEITNVFLRIQQKLDEE